MSKSSKRNKDDIQDYVELINKVQRHTRCSPSYCIRINREKQQVCRFRFPKEISDHSFIREDNHGQPKFISARNDPYINAHNRLQLQGWRANVDIKPVLSLHAALQYVSKYASKSEPKSAAFSEIFNQIIDRSKPKEKMTTLIQKLLLSSIAERDISAQETCHLLLSLPLYHSSRQCITLNLNEEAPRWLYGTGTGTDGNFSQNEEVGRTVLSPLQKYWDRPTELEDISLFQLYLKYNLWRGQ